MANRNFKVWRGDAAGGALVDYHTDVDEGMVVLDALHRIQAQEANDLAIRWNCKAGKCGSCSMEINGRPRLACMTRMDDYGEAETLTVQPMKAFPIIRDLVTDVSWNYKQNQKITPLQPKARDADGQYRMMQQDVDRVQEFRKCIECYLCQDTCHVIRDHAKQDAFVGPRFMIRLASLEMHPLDTADRIPAIKEEYGVGLCNITRCCTAVCPEHINLTDNGIIPLKERVVDRYYDPLMMLINKFRGKNKR